MPSKRFRGRAPDGTPSCAPVEDNGGGLWRPCCLRYQFAPFSSYREYPLLRVNFLTEYDGLYDFFFSFVFEGSFLEGVEFLFY